MHKDARQVRSDQRPFIRPTSRLGEEHTTLRGDTFSNGDAVILEIGGAYRKYQAPLGRLIYVGEAPKGAEQSAQLAIDGMEAICKALMPGNTTGSDFYFARRKCW